MIAIAGVLALGVAACPSPDTDEPATEQTPDDQAATDSDGDDEMGENGEEASAENPFAELRDAAHHVRHDGSAKTLAGGIAAAAGLEGDIDSQAAQTYATLSNLLQEHVYLAGIAIDAGLSFGLDSGEFEAAAATLDENSVELADVVGGAAGEENGEAFLSLWREHIGFFVDYTQGAAEGDEEAKQEARESLDGYRSQAGAFFEEITAGALPADAVAENLSHHVETVIAAIDSFVAGEADGFDNLKAAANHVDRDGSAKVLAGGFIQALEMEGDIDAPAVGAYVTLSALLQEHVYLAGIAIKTGVAEGLDSPAFEAAAGTLDQNSVELADVVGSVAGQENRDAFLGLWREHIGFFVEYTQGAASGDEQQKQAAVESLDGYRQQAGGFFEEITGGELPADAVADELDGHVRSVTDAIDALVSALTGQS